MDMAITPVTSQLGAASQVQSPMTQMQNELSLQKLETKILNRAGVDNSKVHGLMSDLHTKGSSTVSQISGKVSSSVQTNYAHLELSNASEVVMRQVQKIKKSVDSKMDSIMALDPESMDAKKMLELQMVSMTLSLELELASKTIGGLIDNVYQLIRT